MYLKLCNFWFKNFSVPIYLNYIYELIKQRHMNKLVWVSKQNQSLVNVTGVLENGLSYRFIQSHSIHISNTLNYLRKACNKACNN